MMIALACVVATTTLVPILPVPDGLPTGHHHRRHRAHPVLLQGSQPPSAPPQKAASLLRPRMADILISGAGLAGSIAMLSLLEDSLGVKLFAAPMTASGIIFFSGPRPPNPRGFIFGTLCSCTISVAIILLLQQYTNAPPVIAQGISAGALLIWFKLIAGEIFPPAAVLAGTLVGTIASNGPEVGATHSDSLSAAFNFLCFPWLAGHAGLYAGAMVISPVRSSLRVHFAQRRLRETLFALGDDELRTIFSTYDVDESGALDAFELRVALRAAVGAELELADCERLVSVSDCNGDGVVDFDEFAAICRLH
jgi:CBS-domain-containing membrane protein